MHARAAVADVPFAMFAATTTALNLRHAHPWAPALLPNAVAVAYCCWLADPARLERATDLCLWLARHLRRRGHARQWHRLHVPALLADSATPLPAPAALELGMFLTWSGLSGLMPPTRAHEQLVLLDAACPEACGLHELADLVAESARLHAA